MPDLRQEPPADDNPIGEFVATVVDDPEVRDMTVGFIRTLYAEVTKDLLHGDRRTRMEIAKTFLTPILRDSMSRRGSKSEGEAALAARAAEIRSLIGGILPDDD